MNEQRITETLRRIARQGVPDSVDLWPAIKAQLKPRRRPSRWGRLMPTTRLGWAFLILTLILAFGAVAYAVSPAVGQLFQQESGLQHVEQANLVQELNLSQTVDGITVTVERAYADANRIVIGFTIKTPGDQRYEVRRLTLTDAAGNLFPWIHGYGAAGQSDIYKVSLPPGEGAYVFTFDAAAAVVGAPEELDLRLVMDLEELVLPPDASAEPTVSMKEELLSLHVAPHPPPLVVEELLPMPQGAIVGPFVFDFGVPFIPGRVIEVRQAVKAAGVAITLQRVVVTPSETQATLCFRPPDGSKEWLLITAGDGGDLFAETVTQSGEECHRIVYAGVLAERSSTAALTVTELVGFDLAPPGKQTRLAGPWEFHFQVP